jgi:hypothetical protein
VVRRVLQPADRQAFPSGVVGRCMSTGTYAAEVTVQASVHDHITVLSQHVGERLRIGEIVEVRGTGGAPPYVVRWSDTGQEALYFPESDAVIRHQPL